MNKINFILSVLLINCVFSQDTGYLSVQLRDYDTEELISEGEFTLIHTNGETTIHDIADNEFIEIELNVNYQIIANKVNEDRNFFTWANATNFTSSGILFNTSYEGLNQVIGYYKMAYSPNFLISDSNSNSIITDNIEIYDEWATGFNSEEPYISLIDWLENNENRVFLNIGESYLNTEIYSYKLRIKRLFSTFETESDGIYEFSGIGYNEISIYYQNNFSFPDSSPYITNDRYLETPIIFYANNYNLIIFYDKVNETAIEDNIIIFENETLVINSGANISFNNNIKLINSGELLIGELILPPTTLNSTSDDFKWGGIQQKETGSLILNNVHLRDSNDGIYTANLELPNEWDINIEIQSSTFSNNNDNLKLFDIENDLGLQDPIEIIIDNCIFFGEEFGGNNYGSIIFSDINSNINILNSNFFGATVSRQMMWDKKG